MIWTDERSDILRTLWAQGLSGSAIAAEIGGSRNSIIGRVHRLGLAKRANPTNARATPAPFRKPRVQRFREVLPMSVEPTPVLIDDLGQVWPEGISLMDLTHETCRWPLWTDANPEHLYCGAPGADMKNKRSYCPFHSRMAYRARTA